MNFKPNIGTAGRVLRAAFAVILLLAAVFIPEPTVLRIILFISAALVFFEAFRGWCLLRACGIRTKL
jgi:hypothetical protein